MAGNPLEDYLRKLSDIRRTGSAVPETSYYGPLAALMDAVGATLKPKVRCIVNPSHGLRDSRCRPVHAGSIPESLGGGAAAGHQAVARRGRGEAHQRRRDRDGR
jgi:hypothetical protein